jgi:hypothetical protein
VTPLTPGEIALVAAVAGWRVDALLWAVATASLAR